MLFLESMFLFNLLIIFHRLIICLLVALLVQHQKDHILKVPKPAVQHFVHMCRIVPKGLRKHNQVQVQPFINGRPLKNDRACISTSSTLPASVYKHPGIYKRSANMTG